MIQSLDGIIRGGRRDRSPLTRSTWTSMLMLSVPGPSHHHWWTRALCCWVGIKTRKTMRDRETRPGVRTFVRPLALPCLPARAQCPTEMILCAQASKPGGCLPGKDEERFTIRTKNHITVNATKLVCTQVSLYYVHCTTMQVRLMGLLIYALIIRHYHSNVYGMSMVLLESS